MNLLASFVDRHPFSTGAIGTVGGFAGLITESLHAAAGIAADLGVIAGALTSFLCFALLLRRWRERRPLKQLNPFTELDPHDDLP